MTSFGFPTGGFVFATSARRRQAPPPGRLIGRISQLRESFDPHPPPPPVAVLVKSPHHHHLPNIWQSASDADGDVAAGRRAPFDARAARPGLGVAAAQGAQEQPQVEDDAGPAGRHLHPEGRPAAVGEGGLQHGRLVAAAGRFQSNQRHIQTEGNPGLMDRDQKCV